MDFGKLTLIFFVVYMLASALYFYAVIKFQGRRFDRKEPVPASILPFLEPTTIRYDPKKQELRQAV